jgi:hypothetical protein
METSEAEYKILVRRSDGIIYKCKRFVIPSYNKIVVSYDLPENDLYTGVTIICVNENSFNVVGEIKEKSWFPHSIVCNDSNQIFIQGSSFDSDKFEYLKVSINKNMKQSN